VFIFAKIIKTANITAMPGVIVLHQQSNLQEMNKHYKSKAHKRRRNWTFGIG
jgi:hypothetical protein